MAALQLQAACYALDRFVFFRAGEPVHLVRSLSLHHLPIRMKYSTPSHPRTALTRTFSLVVMFALSACSSQGALQDVRNNSNPTDRTQRNITNFTPALRCMDDMMFQRGTRDVTVMMEEFRDATQRVPVSARDMMTSAMSDMTRRSRGVRLSLFGSDQQNLAQLLQQAQKTNAFGVIPQYNIRGTISQFDDSISKSGGSVGISVVEKLFGVRAGLDTKFSVMGLDAAVVETSTMNLIPGVSSKNTTVLASRDASAADGQARLENPAIGLVFSFNTARSDGPAQAARNMVELATLELVGKLIHAPYWQCLGVPDTDKEVQREMDDWFLSMDEAERVQYLKDNMRERRYYDGAIDGKEDAGFLAALRVYRKAMGLPEIGTVDMSFFKLFVTTPVPRGPLSPTRKAVGESVASATPSTSEASPAPMTVNLVPPSTGAARKITTLGINVSQSGYVYCYTRDPVTQHIQRIFPNRFVKDPRVESGKRMVLPSAGKFVLNPAAEYACLHAPREVYGDLPPPLRWGDFEDIKLSNFEDIRVQFSESAGLPVQMVVPVATARP